MALAMARGAKAIPEGNETVGADDCNKYQVLSKDPQIRSIELWVSKTSNLPAKLVVTDATTSESTLFLNAAAGRQPAMLFDPPPDYREVAPAAASAKAN